MKTPQQAATAYGTNGSSGTAQANWATDFVANIPKMQTNAARQVGFWQSQVSSPAAAAAFVAGVQGLDVTATTTKVNSVGKASFAAGVRAASTGSYLAFASEFLPAVASEIQTLDRTNPRGDKAQNRARLNAYLDWLDGQAGKFKQ